MLTRMTLEHDQEEVNNTKEDGSAHEELDTPYMPKLLGNSKVEEADRQLEQAANDHIHELTSPPVLVVSAMSSQRVDSRRTRRASLASWSLISHRCRDDPCSCAAN